MAGGIEGLILGPHRVDACAIPTIDLTLCHLRLEQLLHALAPFGYVDIGNQERRRVMVRGSPPSQLRFLVGVRSGAKISTPIVNRALGRSWSFGHNAAWGTVARSLRSDRKRNDVPD